MRWKLRAFEMEYGMEIWKLRHTDGQINVLYGVAGMANRTSALQYTLLLSIWKVWVDWKNKTKKKAASIRTEISCTGGGASRKLILSEQEQRLLFIIGKSAVMGRGPEIGFQNVTPVEEIAVDNAITSSEAEIICTESEIISRDPEIISTPLNVEISTEQVIVPVEQEALNQSQLSRTPAPAIPAASRILSTRPNTEDEEDAEPPRTAGRASTHRVDRRRRRRPTPFQMASVQFAEIEQKTRSRRTTSRS
ncbi:hypothetical protein EVAR_25391_1 [Eumeta japonica]|uniref:Uncharacterized protein n=1 Tax=Eumeta variegata TaxID=151549 RepID=A0A4C1V5K1_EUMVA|nr:hypothetical protein EVAR_25391_1 [Eumeta japonica]